MYTILYTLIARVKARSGPEVGWLDLIRGSFISWRVPARDLYTLHRPGEIILRSLVVDHGSHELYVKGKRVMDFARPAATIPDSPRHIREFLDSVKSRKLTTCDVDYGHKLTKAGLLGNIAYRTGRRIVWDDVREQIVGDSKANKMVTRHYRKPWKLS